MGYIHCCGALHKTRTYRLVPQDSFILCELDYLAKCPVCGHTVVQLTRVDRDDNISVVRKVNKKAKLFFEKLKKLILYEVRSIKYNKVNCGKFYLNYNEFGVKKRCYSNLRTLKIGLAENKDLKINP
ncbi:unknown [Fusobacterium sp. CAG:439]|nr:unknown [Fusobacterium sp. CAG:439]